MNANEIKNFLRPEEFDSFLERIRLLYYKNDITSHYFNEFHNPFEEKIKKYLSANYVFATNSGWSALVSSLLASGVGFGDEVIVPAYTWGQSVSAVLHIGAIPVFADVDLNTRQISVSQIEQLICKKTKAVIVVHLYGTSADIDRINEICIAHQISLIEDCAQAFGAENKKRKLGTLGKYGCFSFNMDKNMPVGGLGAVACQSKDDYENLIRIASKPRQQQKYFNSFDDDRIKDALCFSFLPHPIICELAIFMLDRIDEKNELRKKNRNCLISLLDLNLVHTQSILESCDHVSYLFGFCIKQNNHYATFDVIKNELPKKYQSQIFQYIKCLAYQSRRVADGFYNKRPLSYDLKSIKCINAEQLQKSELVIKTSSWIEISPLSEIHDLANSLNCIASKISKS